MVTVLYFASLREALGLSREQVALPGDGTPTVGRLLESLRARPGAWREALADGKAWRVAVNQQMADPETPIRAGDEVAIFPPVTGG